MSSSFVDITTKSEAERSVSLGASAHDDAVAVDAKITSNGAWVIAADAARMSRGRRAGAACD